MKILTDIKLRPATNEDYDFLFSLHRETLKDYVDATWGWEENWQQEYFREHFTPAEIDIIQFKGEDIGCLSVRDEGDHLFLAYIAVLPNFQRQGIGTRLIKGVMDEAEEKAVPVTLRVLRVNPARALYEHLGFEVVKMTDERCFMETYPSNR
jgi:ribosomal protein S18 acetylase RimI-like enzyme